MIESIIFILWVIAVAISSIPPLGRWVSIWITRIVLEGDILLEKWTQNLLRS